MSIHQPLLFRQLTANVTLLVHAAEGPDAEDGLVVPLGALTAGAPFTPSLAGLEGIGLNATVIGAAAAG